MRMMYRDDDEDNDDNDDVTYSESPNDRHLTFTIIIKLILNIKYGWSAMIANIGSDENDDDDDDKDDDDTCVM